MIITNSNPIKFKFFVFYFLPSPITPLLFLQFFITLRNSYCKHFPELMTAAENMIAIREKRSWTGHGPIPTGLDRPSFIYFFAAGQIKNKPADRSNAPVIDRSTKRSVHPGPNFLYPKSLVMTHFSNKNLTSIIMLLQIF